MTSYDSASRGGKVTLALHIRLRDPLDAYAPSVTAEHVYGSKIAGFQNKSWATRHYGSYRDLMNMVWQHYRTAEMGGANV